MEKPLIYKQLSIAMSEIGAVTKDKKNQQQGFSYRGIDDVYNAVNPVLARNGLIIVPEVIDQKREERTTARGINLIYTVLTIRYTIYAEDGSSVFVVVVGEGMDSGDKSCNKAMSIAYKYAMFQLFCIPTEETVDPDAEVQEPSIPANAIICEDCGAMITGVTAKGKDYTPEDLAENSMKSYGKKLCYRCMKAHKNDRKEDNA